MRIAICLLIYLLSAICTYSFSTDNKTKGLAVAPQEFFWIGGPGSWDDPSHWGKWSGGPTTGVIPDASIIVIFDNNSGLSVGDLVTIPPGSHDVLDLNVQTSAKFELRFDGSSGNVAAMNVFGDLFLSTEMNLIYNDPSVFHNVWRFQDSNVHNITTNGQDLSSVEFLHVNGEYNQSDVLNASERIKMHGGLWNSNNYDIHAGILLFQDDNGSGSPLNKDFNAGTSNIYCDQWRSTLTYQSLVVTGNYVIHTARFQGSPGTPALSFYFKEIHLTDFIDDAPGGFSQIEHNNFDCAYCEVERIIIEDVSRVQLAGIFTVTDELEVVHSTATILFNGGNSHEDEVILQCDIKLPNPSGCDGRVLFSNIYCDFTTVTSNAPSLDIKDVIVNNLQTNGSANFSLSNSVLQGSSSGWTLNNPPVGQDYLWVGVTGTSSEWSDATKWELLGGGSTGCIPSIVDNVYVTNNSKGDLRIPSPFKAQCKDFIWTNTKSRELILDGQLILESELEITGNFEIDASATINAIQNHEMIFSAASAQSIRTFGVTLPDIYFVGDLGNWTLLDDLTCDKILFEGGTLDTDDNDFETDDWLSIEDNPKHFIFGSSTIKVNGEMKLAPLPNNNVTVTPGTSLIECELLTSAVPVLYDVQLNNSNTILLDNWPQSFNRLILNGAGSVGTDQDLTLNELVFKADNSELQVDTGWDFVINEEIESLAAKTQPGILRSKTPGSQADVDKTIGNLCVMGYVGFQDINAILSGVMHAPLGFDNGNNSNLVFDGGSSSPDLFWIGGSGDWNTESNWSRVTGGCPAFKDPNSSPNLVFDNYSFVDPTNQIDINSGNSCHNVYIRNTDVATFNVVGGLNPDNIYVEGGDGRFEGNILAVKSGGVIEVESGGVFISDMSTSFTPQTDLNTGLLIVRAGSNFSSDMTNINGTLIVESGANIMTDTMQVQSSGSMNMSGNSLTAQLVEVLAGGQLTNGSSSNNFVVENLEVFGTLSNDGTIKVEE